MCNQNERDWKKKMKEGIRNFEKYGIEKKNSATENFRCAYLSPSLNREGGGGAISCSQDGADEQSRLCATSLSRGEP